MILLGVGDDSIFSDFVILLFVTSIYWGTLYRLPYLKIYQFRNYKLIKYFTILMILGGAAILFPCLLNFGLSFRGLREFYEYVVFSPYASFYEIVRTLLIILILFLFVKKQKITLPIAFLVLVLCFSGGKMAILSTVIILATMWEEYKPMNYKFLFLILGCVFIGLIFYHYSQSLNVDNRNVFENALSYFDVYRQQSLALDMFQEGKLDYFHGEISLSSLYKVIPRFIWENKPKDYGFALLNYKIYPDYSANGYMPSFGLAYTYADFGFISIVLSGFFVGFMKNYFHTIFYKNSKNVVSFLLYILDINIVLIVLFTSYYLISNITRNNHDT